MNKHTLCCHNCRWTKPSEEVRKMVFCRQFRMGIGAKAARLCYEPRPSRSSKVERAPYKGEAAGSTPAVTTTPNGGTQRRRDENAPPATET